MARVGRRITANQLGIVSPELKIRHQWLVTPQYYENWTFYHENRFNIYYFRIR